MLYTWPSWIESVIEVSIPVVGAILIVVLMEFFLQGKDNSWNVFKKSQGRNLDIFSISMFLFRMHPIVMDILLVGILVKIKKMAEINSLNMYLDGGLWSTAFTMILSLIVYDFLLYWSHRFKHYCNGAWFFHRYHHSTSDLNAFSFIRVHTLDYPLRVFSVTIPMLFIAGPSFGNIAWLWFAETVSDTICHSRLNISYGVLGKIFVGPRFHRRHHDLDDHHCNFGLIFSFWDRLFGTYKDESNAFSRPTGTRQLNDSGNVVKIYFGEYVEFGKWFIQKVVRK